VLILPREITRVFVNVISTLGHPVEHAVDAGIDKMIIDLSPVAKG